MHRPDKQNVLRSLLNLTLEPLDAAISSLLLADSTVVYSYSVRSAIDRTPSHSIAGIRIRALSFPVPLKRLSAQGQVAPINSYCPITIVLNPAVPSISFCLRFISYYINSIYNAKRRRDVSARFPQLTKDLSFLTESILNNFSRSFPISSIFRGYVIEKNENAWSNGLGFYGVRLHTSKLSTVRINSVKRFTLTPTRMIIDLYSARNGALEQDHVPEELRKLLPLVEIRGDEARTIISSI